MRFLLLKVSIVATAGSGRGSTAALPAVVDLVDVVRDDRVWHVGDLAVNVSSFPPFTSRV